MGVELDTSEVRALGARIQSAGGEIGPRANAVLRRTAHAIEADAKQLAPVDTGALRSSISTSIAGGGAFMTAEVGPTVEYGVYQEYGTSEQSGTPFMGPAFDRHAPGFSEALARIAEQAIS
ncbi:HK97 gp10 family phage protein [Nocardioides sp. SOB77]|uniref:HK97 gp10 family phage protein n=1 Tax=Nocardioides oceani TaxID=3058369 RepID=A0ABT8FH97_9ACTN|nr:HK97-gp10 family putative phage morphogenesis protein [Nocardioides oceani]MDN4173921.1 HK97 gp10 family phage protein [Nocardioides oceani]